VFRIARNVIKDHYKVSGRRREVLDAELGDLPSATTTDEWVDDQDAVLAEMAVCLRPLLSELPADYRRALELTDLGGMSQAEAAELEHVSLSGMKSRAAGPTPARRRAAPVLHSHPRQPRRPRRLPAPPRRLPLTAHAQGSSRLTGRRSSTIVDDRWT
jgi:hypothetical protein